MELELLEAYLENPTTETLMIFLRDFRCDGRCSICDFRQLDNPDPCAIVMRLRDSMDCNSYVANMTNVGQTWTENSVYRIACLSRLQGAGLGMGIVGMRSPDHADGITAVCDVEEDINSAIFYISIAEVYQKLKVRAEYGD